MTSSRRSYSRSSSIELFPSFDAEPILRPRIEETPCLEVVVESSEVDFDQNVPKTDRKSCEIRKTMMERIRKKIYTDSNYGKRNCLWSSKKLEIPQKVTMVPSSFVLFKSVRSKRIYDDVSEFSRAWEREKAKGRKKIWKARVRELKEEQKLQIRMGAVVVCKKGDGKEKRGRRPNGSI